MLLSAACLFRQTSVAAMLQLSAVRLNHSVFMHKAGVLLVLSTGTCYGSFAALC